MSLSAVSVHFFSFFLSLLHMHLVSGGSPLKTQVGTRLKHWPFQFVASDIRRMQSGNGNKGSRRERPQEQASRTTNRDWHGSTPTTPTTAKSHVTKARVTTSASAAATAAAAAAAYCCYCDCDCYSYCYCYCCCYCMIHTRQDCCVIIDMVVLF